MRPRSRSFRSRYFALCAAGLGLALFLGACGGDSDPAEDDTSTPAGEPTAHIELEYDGLPTDLSADEVCALLDDATISQHLDAEVTGMTAGTSQPDCQWFYKLEGGPATNLHVQVMSMEQTSERLGVEALEWALNWAPSDVEVTEVESLDVPNGTYEFGSSTVVFAIDPAGRLFTVSTYSETSEAGRLALVEEVLAGLTAVHP